MLLSHDQSLFYLKGGKEYYLVLETEKSRERAMAEILMIDKIVSSIKINRMKCGQQ
jgi:hypothetical protein